MAGIWAVNFTAIKAGLDAFEPFAFNALRFPLAAGLLLSALVVTGRTGRPERRDVPRIVGLGLLGHVAYQLLFILGMDRTRAGNASLLLTGSPVYTAILSAALGHERVRTGAWAGVAATTAGIALVLGSSAGFGFGAETVVGDLLIVAAALVWAVYTVGARDLVRKYGSLRVTAWVLAVGAALLFLVGIPDLVRMRELPPPLAWGSVVYAGLLGIGVGHLLWYRGVQRIGNTRTAVFQNLVPPLALAVAWVALDEVPTPLQVLGAIVIIAGVTVVRRSMTAAERSGA
jgi:drug/metabolite transporter (DMT)-like permease